MTGMWEERNGSAERSPGAASLLWLLAALAISVVMLAAVSLCAGALISLVIWTFRQGWWL